jgi:hypothetical protein
VLCLCSFFLTLFHESVETFKALAQTTMSDIIFSATHRFEISHTFQKAATATAFALLFSSPSIFTSRLHTGMVHGNSGRIPRTVDNSVWAKLLQRSYGR